MKEHNRGKSSHSQLEALYLTYIDSQGVNGEEMCQRYHKQEQHCRLFYEKTKRCAVRGE